MLMDPDAGKTSGQILKQVWERLRPDLKARYEHLSGVSGRTIPDLLEEAVEIFCERLKDPAYRQVFFDRLAWEAQPFGSDPRVRKDGEGR